MAVGELAELGMVTARARLLRQRGLMLRRELRVEFRRMA